MTTGLHGMACALAMACWAWPAQATGTGGTPAVEDETPGAPDAQAVRTPMPSFESLEALGVRIGDVRIINRDIFDLSDPREDKLLFRWANALHIQTKAEVIERALLFRSGEPLRASLIEETRRLLNAKRYLYDVEIRPMAVHDGVVDIAVETRDTWTLDIGATVNRTGGVTSSSMHINEYNVLGTGVSVSFGRSKDVDRSGNEFRIASDLAFGTHANAVYARAQNDDGFREEISLVQPFYALDSRVSGGLTLVRDNRIDPVYSGGVVSSEYRHRSVKAEAFGGWSAGRVDGWVQRWSAGLMQLDHDYSLESGRTAPPELPASERLRAPYARYELIEDRFELLRNRNLVGLPETFALGWSARVQLGRANSALGSNVDGWIYNLALARGLRLDGDNTLLLRGEVDGRDGPGSHKRRVDLSARYHRPQDERWLLYAGANLSALHEASVGEVLTLGGDTGLRGYPLRYQSGVRMALFTLEERYYTDWFLWRIFRVGAAAFLDMGRAWGGSQVNTADSGWLRATGLGLRLVNVRSAFGNVLHIDLAFPADADTNVKSMQFLVKTRTSF